MIFKHSVFLNFYLHLSIIEKSVEILTIILDTGFFHIFQVTLYVIRDIHIYNNSLL